MGRKRINKTETYILSIGVGKDIYSFLNDINNRSLFIKNLIYKNCDYIQWASEKDFTNIMNEFK